MSTGSSEQGVTLGTSMRLRQLAAALLVALLSETAATGAATAATGPATGGSSAATYIVALAQPPRPGHPVLVARQRAAQDALLDEIGGAPVLYRFTSALDGFAARLTRAQVKQLRSDPAVALVEQTMVQHVDSVHSPRFLGAPRAWAATGGPANAGRGTVVGVLDSGIWPENPSFAALPDSVSGGPAGFHGACQTGVEWDATDCNSKLVSARYFVKGFGEDHLAASEYLSPRDGTGHGSHVAGIAAGDHGVRVQVAGQYFGRASGMAPAARIAVYKICWTAPDPSGDGCNTADAVAAIDQAVADGVDVISYAVSGPTPSRAVELAFLNATAAGVFVATSAGNHGPGADGVGHDSPWVATVGASTHHFFQGAVVLGGQRRVVGAMVSDRPVRRTGIVLGEKAAARNSTPQDARLCRPGSLDADLVQDKIVVCDRGRIPRVDKSAAVARAGGVGMVLANVRPGAVDSDFHSVPTVHLDVADARLVKRYVARSPHPTAAIDPSGSDDTPVPQIARFSSRGAVPDRDDSVLKPDVTAPGVGVLSAVAPPSNSGHRWDLYSGTSMSAAHVAGLAALVMAQYPRWSPAMVKSAMSTTADKLDGASGPLAEGAGQVDAAKVLDPGLVFDAPVRRFREWVAGRVPARNLNLPSIAVGDLAGRSRVVRHVTNVSRRTETYSARVAGLGGVGVEVRPSTLTLSPGETARFAVLFERRTAALDSPARGYLEWTGQRHVVRMPVVVTPRTVDAPAEASGSGASGSVAFPVLPGATGSLALHTSGLTGAKPIGLTLEPGQFDPAHPTVDADTAEFPVDVPPGTSVLRFALEGRATDDLDLYLYRDDDLVATAAGSDADEVLTEVTPEPGAYHLYVSSAVAGNGSTTTAQLYTWVVPDKARGNLRLSTDVTPVSGEPVGVELSWRDLDPTTRWFGSVGYGDSGQRTFLTLN